MNNKTNAANLSSANIEAVNKNDAIELSDADLETIVGGTSELDKVSTRHKVEYGVMSAWARLWG